MADTAPMSMPYQQPPQPPMPPPAPPRKRGPWLIIGIVAAVLAVLCCGGIATAFFVGRDAVEQAAEDLENLTPPSGLPTTGQERTIRFEVTSSTGTVTMINWSTVEDAAVESDVATPWSKEVAFDAVAGLAGVNVSGTGKVGCKLYIDGQLVDEGESELVVNCSTTIS